MALPTPNRASPPGRRDARSAADGIRVSTVMTNDVVCVSEDLTIEELATLFLERGISGAPVVDSQGYPLGVVSKTDIVRDTYEAGGGATVQDIMTPLTFKLYEHAALSQAAALMAYEGVHRVPVVSEQGRVVGILSSLDVMRWLALNDGYLIADPRVGR